MCICCFKNPCLRNHSEQIGDILEYSASFEFLSLGVCVTAMLSARRRALFGRAGSRWHHNPPCNIFLTLTKLEEAHSGISFFTV